MTITIECGGIVVRGGDLTLLFDPGGAWLVWRGRVLARVPIGLA